MILVDTSIWIQFFNAPASRQAKYLEEMILANQPLCINGLIEMEILQGIRSDKDFASTRDYLRDFQYFPQLAKVHFDKAAEIFRACRKRGITVRRSIDCLIAANAIVDGLMIVHHDRDFDAIASLYHKSLCINVP